MLINLTLLATRERKRKRERERESFVEKTTYEKTT